MDSKRVINNSIALFVMDLSGKIVPLVTFPWIVRALGPESYGKVGFATAICGFFGLLASPGFTAYGVREAARANETPRALVQKLMSARIALALISFGLLVGFAFTLAPHDWMTRLLLLLTGTGFLVASVDVQWLYMGHSKMWRVSTATMLSQLLYMAIILACVRRPSDAWIVPVGVTASAVLTAIILLRRARRDFDIGLPQVVPEEWKKFLPICVTLGIASMMSLIYDQIDTVMLRYLRTEAEVGLYVASYRLMAISMSFLGVMSQVFFPLFSGAALVDAKKSRQYVQWMADNTIALALPIATGGFLLAKPICALVMGARYAGAEHLLRWLMLNLLSASAAVLFGSRLIPNNRERQYLWSVAAGALANIALNFVFIPRYGAIAAVFTTIAAQSTVAVFAYCFTRDLVPPDLARPLILSAFATTLMGVAIVTAERVANLHVLFLIAGGAVLYGIVLPTARIAWKQFGGPQAVAAGGEE